ncbi:hypothetical protein DCC79_03705 [bacterium]|nr:MAG: hypothetical protein DCC79_03705 [bacterium]
MTQPSVHALLVGIDAYASPQVPPLGGCVNDVDAMAQLLEHRFGVPPENIVRLTDGAATRAAILDAFETHLIGAAAAWSAAGSPEPSPAFLFHYSGHGSQALDPTGTEPDGLDETLVAHDSRLPDVFDVKDWELAARIEKLTALTDNVTIVLDACHSGSGTRAIAEGVARTRRCPPDLRPQPAGRPPAAAGATRGFSGPSDWVPAGRHVLLAGCRDREESNEMAVPAGEGVRRHGALSYFVVQALDRMPADAPMTYAELHARVRTQVNSRFADQTPQCEGDVGRVVLGGARPARDRLIDVVGPRGDRLVLAGGIAHGLTAGSEVALYPASARTVATAGPPLATATIVDVGATESTAVAAPGADGAVPDLAAIAWPARAAVTRFNFAGLRQRVRVDVPDDAAARRVRERLTATGDTVDPDVTGLVDVVDDDAIDLRIVADGSRLVVQDPAGSALVAPFAAGDLDGLARDLAHIARFRNGQRIANPVPSALAGRVTLALHRLRIDAKGQVVAGPDGQPAIDPLTPGPGGEVALETGDLVVFEIQNHHGVPVYVALVDFAPSWAVDVLYPFPLGAEEALEPGRSVFRGRSFVPAEQLAVSLPGGMPEGRDTVKLIATLRPVDFAVLTQTALKTPFTTRSLSRNLGDRSALDDLLASAANGSRTRAFGPPEGSGDDWTTVDVTVFSTRPASRAGRAVVPEATVDAGHGLSVTAPAGFSAHVRVLTATQSTRSLDGDGSDLQPPPGLAPHPTVFAPLELGTLATRGLTESGAVGAAGAVIELSSDAAPWDAIRPESPLRLGLPAAIEPGAGVLAVAFDGDLYYPVGRLADGDRAGVDVTWLPEPAPAVTGRRDLGGAIRLYLFKTFDLPAPALGLHHARFVPAGAVAGDPPGEGERADTVDGGQIRYRAVRPGEIAAGDRVALFVHGFTSDTHWLIGTAVDLLRENGIVYDHVLSFDYETVRTGIAANGEALAGALRAAGLGPDDGVHVDAFAHSMGTQVVRSMIERFGGHAFVDRAFLAGPPNNGTAIARVKRPVVWLATLLLNQAGPTPPALVARWALKHVADHVQGLDDLAPGSPFYRQLNDAALPGPARYHVVIGRNELRPEARTAWARVARRLGDRTDALLDLVLQGDNDLVIAVHSARELERLRGAERVTVSEVPCDHFGYFSTPASSARIVALAGGGQGQRPGPPA